MDILYYSNFCKHSQKVVQFIVKNNLTQQLSCICVDQRRRDNNNNQMYVVLENGKQVVLPPNLQSIPAVLCVKRNYTLVLGTDPIIEYLQTKFQLSQANTYENPYIKQDAQNYRPQQREPANYDWSNRSNFSNIFSESFTSFSMTNDDLSARSTSARRPLYNYTPVDQQFKIDTPEDTYRPDKVSSNVTIDTLQQQRNQEIPIVQVNPPQNLYGANG